ncbi:MAG: glycosyltransferase [Pyrinomonadaceae bacterium]
MSAASRIDSDVFAFVPSYNHAPFVEKCLRSIIDQSQRPKKLLVIDDGSRDGSPSIIERVLADCPFECELIVRENRGLSATLNQAFELADGCRYFAYLGSDDLWLRDFLRARTELLDSRPEAVLAYGHAYLIDESDRVVDCTREWSRYLDGDPLAGLLEGVVPVTSGVVFRRSALDGLRWNEAALLEDYEMYLRLAARGPFAAADDTLACWRKHSYNTSSEFGRMFDEWIAAQERVAAEIGLSQAELGAAKGRLSFLAATMFLRDGDKTRAFASLKRGWRSARSAGEMLDVAARFFVPSALLRRLQTRRYERRSSKYQKIAAGT